MCTLTIVPLGENRVRLAFNRDEKRTRPAGLPPRQQTFGKRTALLPIDPVSGGTWLAVNDAGLMLAILNVNIPGKPGVPGPRRSRGELIPALLEHDTPAAALGAIERVVRYSDFAPFRLVLVGHGIAADVRWDGQEPMVMSRFLGSGPLLFTSSGLGDSRVEEPRRELFAEMFSGPPDGWVQAQDRFHRHRWPNREHISVNMVRTDSRTVSHAIIERNERSATFLYHADAPDQPAWQQTFDLDYDLPANFSSNLVGAP